MVQAILIVASFLMSFVRWIAGLGAVGSAGSAIIGVIVGSVLLKLLDFFSLGIFTYLVSHTLVNKLINFISVQLSSTGAFDFVPDLLWAMHFPEALSMVISAFSISLTIVGTKTVFKLKPI